MMPGRYLNSDGKNHRLDEKISEYVLKHTEPILALQLPKELCKVADVYWVKMPKNGKRHSCYDRSPSNGIEKYGLSRKADFYNYEYRNIYENSFLDYADAIKADNELTLAFEEFLSTLVESDIEEAAVILDEFRVH